MFIQDEKESITLLKIIVYIEKKELTKSPLSGKERKFNKNYFT